MKILIADDHQIVRDGITMLLKDLFPSAQVTGVASAGELLDMSGTENWDLIISDISMPPGISGLEAVKKIKALSPAVPVLVLSMHPAKDFAVKALKAGAAGYVLKCAEKGEFHKAVNTVLSGRRYLSAEVGELVADACEQADSPRSIDRLSTREREVFMLLVSGKSVMQIADQFFLSTNTVSTFKARIFEKMGFHNILELIKFAFEKDLVQD